MGENSEVMVKGVLMKWYFCWLLLAVSGLLVSCFPDPLLITGLPKVKPQIVVSTQIVPDESLVVLLTKTFGALDASEDSDPQELLAQIAVMDAIVVVTGPSSTDTLISLGNGLYGGMQIPFQQGEQYSLYIKSETLGEVTSTTTVREQVTFDDIDVSLYYSGQDDTLAQVSYSMSDPVGENWYMLNVQEVEQEDVEENLLNPWAFTKLMDDKEFEGLQYGETFRAFPVDFSPGDTIAVSISNVSKDYYDFLKMRIDNRFSFVEYLGEPVNYPSNIVGGKGFFNLYTPDFRVIILEE
jgi:hypothetical protein